MFILLWGNRGTHLRRSGGKCSRRQHCQQHQPWHGCHFGDEGRMPENWNNVEQRTHSEGMGCSMNMQCGGAFYVRRRLVSHVVQIVSTTLRHVVAGRESK